MNGEEQRVKVFVVDDSPLMCRAMERILSQDPAIEVVGRAMSGQEAVRRLGEISCDVCTLDVHMPGMNGLSVLKRVMVRNPLPTVMVSAFTGDGSRVTFEALRYGAVDFFKKPSRNQGEDLEEQGETLRAKIKRAARVKVEAARYLRLRMARGQAQPREEEPQAVAVVAASTGGYASVLSLLPAMAPPRSPVILSLATPARYLRAFVDYLRPFLPFPVAMAEDGMALKGGMAYFVSSDDASAIEVRDGRSVLRVNPRSLPVEGRDGDGEHGPGHESGLDLLMFSASERFGSRVLGVFLSGDRLDGITGGMEIRRNGGRIVAQRPDTCLCPDQIAAVTEKVGCDHLAPSELARQISGWS